MVEAEDVDDDGGLARKPFTIREKRELREKKRFEKEAYEQALYRMESNNPSFIPCGGCGRETCWFGAKVTQTMWVRSPSPTWYNRSEHYLRYYADPTRERVEVTTRRMYDHVTRNL